MEYLQAQFSLKFEPHIRIRRSVNELEDYLEEHYNAPQMMPVPDDIVPEAPRIIFVSKNGHSQISYSQISVDFSVNFDEFFKNDYDATVDYISERLELIRGTLGIIGIEKYYYCGLTYSAKVDIKDDTPVECFRDLTGIKVEPKEIYELSQRTVKVVDSIYFVNEQIGTFKEFKMKNSGVSQLLEVYDDSLISEGVSISVDINNRYKYVYGGIERNIDELIPDIKFIKGMMREYLEKWGR